MTDSTAWYQQYSAWVDRYNKTMADLQRTQTGDDATAQPPASDTASARQRSTEDEAGS